MKNPTQKFLVIGATGLVGKSVCRELGTAVPWKGTVYKAEHPDFIRLDITEKRSVDEVMAQVKPTHVLLCANLSGGVEFCEKNPDVAKKWHFDGTVNVGEACLKYKAKVLYISSECVFDGKKGVYTEEDKINPLNVYGEQKVKSEEWLKKNLSESIIVRTMSVFGWQPETHAPNAVMKVYFTIQKKETLNVPTYRYVMPTYVNDLAGALVELSASSSRGIYHVCGPTCINRYEWMKAVCETMGWESSLLIPDHQEPAGGAVYPRKVRLDCRKFTRQFKTELRGLAESLDLLKKEYLSDPSVAKTHGCP